MTVEVAGGLMVVVAVAAVFAVVAACDAAY